MLYLHETIDILGTGQDAYMESVARRAEHSEREGISRLVACWRVVGSTHRWPRVVNLWEMDGWSHWAETLERQFVAGKQDSELAPWWAKTAEWRSGGFDRILEPVEGSPTRAQLVAGGLSARVCEQTTVRARPGRGDELIEAAVFGLGPVLRRRGMTLFGAYRVPMRSDEVVLLRAAPEFRDLCVWYEERADEPAWQRWQRLLDEASRESETCWLVPGDACFFYPERQG